MVSPEKRKLHPQREKISRGLIAVKAKTGIFLGWRLMADEVDGYSETGVTGAIFKVYRDGKEIATVTSSTNYLDTEGTETSSYQIQG